MCSRFSRGKEFSEIRIPFRVENIAGWSDPLFSKPAFNIAPTQISPIVVEEEARHARLMGWGLVPFWAKDQRRRALEGE